MSANTKPSDRCTPSTTMLSRRASQLVIRRSRLSAHSGGKGMAQKASWLGLLALAHALAREQR